MFNVNLDRCNGSCNTPNDPSIRICTSSKTKDVNLNIFSVVTRMNEGKTLTKHISCDCKCVFDGKKCGLNQKWNNDKHRSECRNPVKYHVCKEDYVWILVRVVWLLLVTCMINNYLKNYYYIRTIVDDYRYARYCVNQFSLL